MGEPTFYFGYGSNLDAEDWAAWCRARGADPTAMVEVCSAWLLDHSMRFHYRSKGRGGGAADVVQDARGTAVPGALFTLSEEGWNLMNRKEGHPNVYHQTPVQVITAQGEAVEAVTYVVQPAQQRSELVAPTQAYAALIRDGLVKRQLPIGHLKSSVEHLDAKSTIDHVFVYGTLMKGNERWPRMRPWSTEGPVIGSVRGRLYHLGHYPGLRLDEGGVVHGEVYRCEDIEGALGELDTVEGVDSVEPSAGLYLRVPVRVDTKSGTRWAWTYVINQLPSSAVPLDDGRWVA